MLVERADLPQLELEARDFGGAEVCLIFVDAAPGEGPKLHRHAYGEIFIVLEGTPMFTIGSESLLARAGQVLLVRAGVAHKFINTGPGILRQVDVHLNSEFVTEWLED